MGDIISLCTHRLSKTKHSKSETFYLTWWVTVNIQNSSKGYLELPLYYVHKAYMKQWLLYSDFGPNFKICHVICKYSKIWKNPKSKALLVPITSKNDTPLAVLKITYTNLTILLKWNDNSKATLSPTQKNFTVFPCIKYFTLYHRSF